MWKEKFVATQDPQGDWPEGIQLFNDRIYEGGKLCVPTPLQNRVIYDHHKFLGHVGFVRI